MKERWEFGLEGWIGFIRVREEVPDEVRNGVEGNFYREGRDGETGKQEFLESRQSRFLNGIIIKC